MYNLTNNFLTLSRKIPDALAIDAPGRLTTYAELYAYAIHLAQFLENKSIASGDRVGIALTRNDEALFCILALWILDATAVVIDFRSTSAERAEMVKSTAIKAFIQDRPAMGTDKYPVIDFPADWSDKLHQDGPEATAIEGSNDVAMIGTSSGTTGGAPKPVALSHECLYARYTICRTSPQWNPGGRFLATAPLAFSATRKHVLSRLLDGGTVIFMPMLAGAAEIRERAISAQANSMLTVPTIARQLMELHDENAGIMFPDMEWMMCCGAPMTPQEKIDVRSRLCSGFVQNYGSTMAGMITLLETKDLDSHAATVGKPLPHVLVEVVDDDHRPVAVNQVGAIRVLTPGTGRHLPDFGTGELHDGWIYTGDNGYIDDEGFITITGRSSEVIIRSGVNIYPMEIESMLTSHPNIREAAVVGKPLEDGDEEIVAFVVPDGDIGIHDVLVFCRSRLQPDKQPREVFLVSEMPYNENGKLMKRVLVDSLQ